MKRSTAHFVSIIHLTLCSTDDSISIIKQYARYFEAVDVLHVEDKSQTSIFRSASGMSLIILSNRVQFIWNMLEIKGTIKFVCVFQLRRLQSNAVSCLARKKNHMRRREWKTPSSFVTFSIHAHCARSAVSNAIVKKHRLFFFSHPFFFSPTLSHILMTLLHSSLSFIMSINVNHSYITHSIWLKYNNNNNKKLTRRSRLLELRVQTKKYVSNKCARYFGLLAFCWSLFDWLTDCLNEWVRHLTSIVTPYQSGGFDSRRCAMQSTHHIVRSMMAFNISFFFSSSSVCVHHFQRITQPNRRQTLFSTVFCVTKNA